MIGLLIVIFVVLVGATIAILGIDRYRPRNANASSHSTDEVFIDPETGRRVRVWFDSTTGAREYRDD